MSGYLESDRAKDFLSKEPRTQYDDQWVVCPYCGVETGDCWEWVKEHVEEMKCDECGGQYNYWAEYSVTYYASPIREVESGTEKNSG